MAGLDSTPSWMRAISYAARAHATQMRKDRATPYAAHAFRVAMIVRHLFGIEDDKVLCAAVLHDTLEDTLTDFDDLASEFGTEVAQWVATLSHDKRMPEAERDAEFRRAIAAGPAAVHLIKLADIYDNLSDAWAVAPDRAAQQNYRIEFVRTRLAKSRSMMEELGQGPTPAVERAYQMVEALLAQLAASLPA